MALLEAGRYQVLTASGGGTLTPPDYESWRIRDLFCVPSANDTFLTLGVAGKTLGVIRVKGKSGNHLPYPVAKTTQLYEAPAGLFALLRARGFALDIPVAQGEPFTVGRYAEAGRVGVVYDAYDAGDVKPDEPNGSKAAVRTFLHYLTNSAAITSSASPTTLDTSLQPAGLTTWPVGGVRVPSKCRIELLGILGCPHARGNASANKGLTTGLALIRENGAWLLDPTQAAGIPFLGDVAVVADAETYSPVASLIGPFAAEVPKAPLFFDPPVAFEREDTLTPRALTTGAASGGMGAQSVDVALILRKTEL